MARIERPCLVIIDVQQKLMAVMEDGARLLRKIPIAIQAAKILGMPIVWLQQRPEALGPTVPEVLAHLEGLEPIDKACFSAWGSPQFRERLRGLQARSALICGIEAHVCVYQTAIDLSRCGLEVHVLADVIASRNGEDRQMAILRMASEGVKISTTEMALFDLLETADHPRFKEVSRLIK
ncbi:MAG: isochorismatase family protein [Sedimentisphaerales bacterium]|jgi:nicotinamidase-related amidase|nr:isochorismatase family protein [Sedimentisphaerales bacterium]